MCPVSTAAVRLKVPGDKSISHRALILAAVASGVSELHGVLDSADIRSTANALRALGVTLEESDGVWTVRGVGLHGLRTPSGEIDCGNSGTTARLLAGVIAGAGIQATLVGDASLTRRPMRRIAEPLEHMGARVAFSPGGTLPMRITGGRLRELDWPNTTASAQVKSALLLAGLLGRVRVTVREPVPTRDHTERMFLARGVRVVTDQGAVSLTPADSLPARDTRVPADPSSAAFFGALAAAGGAGPAGLLLEDVCVSPARSGFFRAIGRMGASLEFQAREGWEEPVAGIHVRPAALSAVEVEAGEVPAMVDELPILACLAARAEGESRVSGAAELRVKESDRIAAVVTGLRAVGADASERPDGLRVRGDNHPLAGTVSTYGDHRIAMAFGTLGALHGNSIAVDDPACVSVSYPGFWSDLERVRG